MCLFSNSDQAHDPASRPGRSIQVKKTIDRYFRKGYAAHTSSEACDGQVHCTKASNTAPGQGHWVNAAMLDAHLEIAEEVWHSLKQHAEVIVVNAQALRIYLCQSPLHKLRNHTAA